MGRSPQAIENTRDKMRKARMCGCPQPEISALSMINEAVRATIRSLIEDSDGLRVCGEAADGLDAIEKARDLKPDLILLDLAMPKLNGTVTAFVIRRIMPKVPIILFTLYEDAADKLGKALGVDMVLAKPDGIRNLVMKVHNLFPRQRSGNHGLTSAALRASRAGS
jgi:DNA-binding NarL/FixJ family response regulator